MASLACVRWHASKSEEDDRNCYFWTHLPETARQVAWKFRTQGESAWSPLSAVTQEKDGWWRSTWNRVGEVGLELRCEAWGVAAVECVTNPSVLDLKPFFVQPGEVPPLDAKPAAAAGAVWCATRESLSSEKSCYLWVYLPDQVTWKYRAKKKTATWGDAQLANCNMVASRWWRTTKWSKAGEEKWEFSCWVAGVPVVQCVSNPSLLELGPALAGNEVPGEQPPDNRALLAELRQNPILRRVVPKIDEIVDIVKYRLSQLAELDRTQTLEVPFDASALGAVLCYAYDLFLPDGEERGNLYKECSDAIKARNGPGREAMIEAWRVFLHFALKGLDALPLFTGEGFSCVPEGAEAYPVGELVEWHTFGTILTGPGAFGKVTQLADPGQDLILKFTLTRAKLFASVAIFPCAGEAAVYPMSLFRVTSAPYQKDGFTCVDLAQHADDRFHTENWIRNGCPMVAECC